ncbi:ATP-binding protein [Clostridium sp. BL-8]|uniref:ATP-binding protein n=1 Tax=Clostridium sp. BL-8 TaxID=349938 RepID=UPI001FA82051|nr:ATP-binding protein [Clostridium sp. BL-8]
MEIDYMDVLDSISQGIFFVYMISYCLRDKKIFSDKKKIVCMLLLSCGGYFIPNIFGNFSICVFVTHIFSIVIIVFFFKNKYIEALVAFNLIYSIGAIWMLIFGDSLYEFLECIIFKRHIELLSILFVYVCQLLLYIICIKYPNKIRQIYKIMQAEKFTISCIFIMSFTPDFLLSLGSIEYNDEALIYQNIKIVIFMVFIGFSAVYFAKIKERANKIFQLNESLEAKNSELKKIKCDYGIQMSSLYELCLREKYEDVAGLLKSIINTPNSSKTGEKGQTKESLLSLATKHVMCDDINIIIDDNADFKLIAMSEMELYRIIVNIVNNAIKAMKNRGTLIAKSFSANDKTIIEIENDGEKIPEKYIDKIFEAGFTTKNNSDKNHGYGLNIVKELIESYGGNISVESSEVKTKFTIILPIRSAKNTYIC